MDMILTWVIIKPVQVEHDKAGFVFKNVFHMSQSRECKPSGLF